MPATSIKPKRITFKDGHGIQHLLGDGWPRWKCWAERDDVLLVGHAFIDNSLKSHQISLPVGLSSTTEGTSLPPIPTHAGHRAFLRSQAIPKGILVEIVKDGPPRDIHSFGWRPGFGAVGISPDLDIKEGDLTGIRIFCGALFLTKREYRNRALIGMKSLFEISNRKPVLDGTYKGIPSKRITIEITDDYLYDITVSCLKEKMRSSNDKNISCLKDDKIKFFDDINISCLENEILFFDDIPQRVELGLPIEKNIRIAWDGVNPILVNEVVSRISLCTNSNISISENNQQPILINEDGIISCIPLNTNYEVPMSKNYQQPIEIENWRTYPK